MKFSVAGLLSLLALPAAAGGLDTTGQSIAFLFNEGTVAELGYGRVSPSISGTDAAFLGGGASGNIGEAISLPMASFKHDFTEKLSFGVIVEKPFSAGITYGVTSLGFGGTTARANTTSVTALLRYKFGDRVSIYGGRRWQAADAYFGLTGGIYGPLSGYAASMARDQAVGFVAGAAFEIPEYFLRVSLTYNSEIDHSFTTTETSPISLPTVSQISATTPQSLNLEFISGIAPSTFVFGGARWVEWSKLQFAPPVLSGFSADPLVDFEDTITYSFGLGRQVLDRWTLTGALIYEPSTDRFTTPLTPTDGFFGVSLGAVYAHDGFQVQANIAATQLDDATPFVGPPLNTTVSSFSGNTSIAVGVKLVKIF